MYSQAQRLGHGTRAKVRDNISCKTKTKAGIFRSKKSKEKI